MCVKGGRREFEPAGMCNEFIDFNLDSIPVQGPEDDWREKYRMRTSKHLRAQQRALFLPLRATLKSSLVSTCVHT